MKCLFFTDSYPPEICSAANLMQDIVTAFIRKGNEAVVITFQPHGRVKKNNNIELDEITIEQNLKVIRLYAPKIHVRNFFIRGVNTILSAKLIEKQSIEKLGKITNNFDFVFSYSPPINSSLSISRIAKQLKIPFILFLRDLFPQNAIDLGIIHNRLIIKYFEGIERKLYQNSDIILVQSEANNDFLINQKNVDVQKINVLYNCFDLNSFGKASKFGIRLKYGLNGKFICLYGGTMGPAQGLDMILEAAHQLIDNKDIILLMVGNGREKNRLEKKASVEGLKNMIFEDYLNPEDFFSLIKESDIGLMTLSKLNKTPIVPGKLLSYMAGELPIVAALNKESIDTIKILKDSGGGKYIIGDDPVRFSELIKELFWNKDRKEMGIKGRKYVEEFFNCDNSVDKIIDIVYSLKKRGLKS